MTPAEAGLGWTVRVAGRSVIGQETLEEQSASPADHCRVWPVMGSSDMPVGARIVSAGSDEVVGRITSSTHSPTLDGHVGIARFEIPGWPGDTPLCVRPDGLGSHPITVGRGSFLDPRRERLTVELH